MKKTILLIATSFLIASSVHAVPLTWHFVGTTGAFSFNGTPIAAGLNCELRIFLDTDLVGVKPPGLADTFFAGPHQGELQIETLGVLPVGPFNNVQNFGTLGVYNNGVYTGPQTVTGVQFNNPGFSGIQFASSISSDLLHLGPIAPSSPNAFNSITVYLAGQNGSAPISLRVDTFSATTVPEGGSTALLLTSALVASGFLRRRINRTALSIKDRSAVRMWAWFGV